LKEEAPDRVWRTARFGKGCGPLVRETTDWAEKCVHLQRGTRTKYTNTCRKDSQKHNYICNIQSVSVYTNVSANYIFRLFLVRPPSGWIP